MKYERLTRKSDDGYEIKRELIKSNSYNEFLVDSLQIVINRLTELEDKIERGELVDVKENHLIPISRANGKSSKQLETIDILTKYENGTLVELPCKVGDKFYQVVKGLPIYEWEVETIVFSNIYFPKNYVITARRIKDLVHWKFWKEDFGERLFLTKSEAEKKLKELEK